MKFIKYEQWITQTLRVCVLVCKMSELGDGILEKEKKQTKTDFSSDISLALQPPTNGCSSRTDDYTESPAHRPPGWNVIEENDLKDESEDHIHGLHDGHESCFFYLNCFSDKDLAPQTHQSNEYEKQPVQPTVRQTPLS